VKSNTFGVPIIGITGYAQSGKSTLGELIVHHNGAHHANFADLMRDFLYAINPLVTPKSRIQDLVDHLGWERAKVGYPEVRQLMQRLGTDAGRKLFGETFWVDQFFANVGKTDLLVISDVRFPNEAQAIKDRGGIIVRIVRDGYEPVSAHVSETSYNDQDFTIYNDAKPDDLYVFFRNAFATYLTNTTKP
jgi:hypothetical protein